MTTEPAEGDAPPEEAAPSADELSGVTREATAAEVADEGYGVGVVDPATGLVDSQDEIVDPER
jgi:hypothetical protein